ncbi:TPA: primosomal replication protein [Mannheimia haemolytica]|nr:primosomal replication protein [Mannheimia haemolytica]
MQKKLFIAQIKQNLSELNVFSTDNIFLNSPYFSQQTGLVSVFIAEIEKTVELLLNQTEVLYSEFYAEKLVKQVDALKNAVEKIQSKPESAQFHSSYQFSPKIHRLAPNKRLQEYRKALRALNEKISWLVEQNLNTQNEATKQTLQNQITETEYRKMKCLKAIEDLEQELLFK